MKTIRCSARVFLLVSVLYCLAAAPVFAHHSPFLFFDPSNEIVLEGEIADLKWRNPHVLISLDTNDGKIYEVEANSVSILQRMGLSREDLSTGARIRVAGWGSVRGADELFVTNLLKPDGTELLMFPGAQPKWSTESQGDSSTWLISEEDLVEGESDAEGIFHVWATSLANPGETLVFDGYDFDLTESAAIARASYDMFESVVLSSCQSKGMPAIMEQPYPIQFAKGDDVIFMHMEEGDSFRVIDMSSSADYGDREPIPMGYSVGHWEGDVLVVTTTGSSWEHTDMTGVPNTPDAVFLERFTPSENGKRLDYSLTITDPATFNQPQSFSKHWLWVPGERVEPYNCVLD